MSALLAMLVGGSGPRAAITNRTINDSRASPTNPSAGYRLNLNGNVEQVLSGGTTTLEQWVTPTGAAGASYECRATVTAGSITSGTAGTWLPLSSSQTWSLLRTTVGLSTATLTIEIRSATTLAVLATATVTLEADKS